MKDPDKVLLPSCDFVLITFGEDESVDRIMFTLLDDLPLDRDHGSVIVGQRLLVGDFGAKCRFGSRSQLPDRIEDGLVELIQLSSLQFPV